MRMKAVHHHDARHAVERTGRLRRLIDSLVNRVQCLGIHGLSRGDLKEMGDAVDEGLPAVVAVGEDRLEDTLSRAGKRAVRVLDKEVDAHADALRQLLRGVFRAAGGTHDDWDEYDRTMREQRRTAVLVVPTRIYSNG